MGFLEKIFGDYSAKEVKKINPTLQKVLDLENKYKEMTDTELKAQTPALKERLSNGETLDDILPDAFAVCREASARVLKMRHFPVQIIGGIVLHQGRIAEMRTGEGKTLVATLPSYLNALSGKGVHVVTVNDYLARRDSEWMGKIHRFLGLKVGLIAHDMQPAQRREAYNADITYGTNNEMGFDYLRDNMVPYKEGKVQREHNFAIVDEVDSILVDEARTPLIISGTGDASTDLYKRADTFARTLTVTRVKEINAKEDTDDQFDGDYVVDEKARTATLTEKGVQKAEAFFHLENLMDAENLTIQHHINQAIKAHGVMHRDIEYVVKDGEVLIVDEFTGRIMIGRRYNEGLHQAIEAKEGVKIENESKTLATITFQNYFRLYSKLSGMTGTAMTEKDEFQEIYKLDVVEIPTNKPLLRIDDPDVVYKTEKAKFNAIIQKVIECNEKGQPVLVGTVSIDKSEKLSAMLKRRGIKHEVLNAKHHDKEAEIVAQAGHYGAVTIATNMAGRGTDIMLGGNSEFLAKSDMRRMGYDEEIIEESTAFGDTDDEKILEARRVFSELNDKHRKVISVEAERVRDVGGLCILGTERHESRRIDNQLRGRAGRQGDPGYSRFYLYAEDDLLRLFGGDRIQNIFETMKIDEDTAIDSKILSNTIEGAQRKVESKNFAIRKNVLEYDDVMNRQREIIYDQRNQVLDGVDLKETILRMLDDSIAAAVAFYCSPDLSADDWDFNGLREKYIGWLTTSDDFIYKTPEELGEIDTDEIVDELTKRGHELYEKREQEFGSDIMRDLERMVLLRMVDSKWMDHIDAMEELKRGIGLRAYGNRNPVVEYRVEGFDMFDDMIRSIREDTVKLMLTVRIQREEDVKREEVAKPTQVSGGSESAQGTTNKTIVNKDNKVGRNDACPCGSGKKYKKCCGANK